MKKLIIAGLMILSGLLANAQTADELFEAKEYNKAYNAYKQIDENARADIKVLRRLGYLCYISENSQEQGIGYLTRAIKIDPKDVVSNYYLGVLYVQLKEKEKGKQYLQIAADLGSDEAKAELKNL